MLGFLLFIIPGIILMLKLLSGFFLIVDEDLGVIDALKKSWKITKGFKWKLFLFVLVYYLFIDLMVVIFGNSLGYSFITIIIGLIVSPVFFYSFTYFYRTLLQQTQPYDFGDIRTNAFGYRILHLNNISLFAVIIVMISLLIFYANVQKSSFDSFYQQLTNNYLSSLNNLYQPVSYQNNDVAENLDITLPIDFPQVEYNMTRIYITEVGSIDIDNKLEVQNEAWRQSVENYSHELCLSTSNNDNIII